VEDQYLTFATEEVAAGEPVSAPVRRPVRVCVLVDLLWQEAAGGHVKYWERVAAGAADLDPGAASQLDLTVYFASHRSGEHRLARHVRYRLLKPVFGTMRLPFLGHVPDHTDLSPYHPRLARELGRYDVIHTTDCYFAFARTALRLARRRGIPLVNSVHTDTPGYTRIYMGETVRHVFGRGWLSRVLLERFHVDERAQRKKLALLRRHQAACSLVFCPRDEDVARARAVLPAERVLRLPRGLELQRFSPAWRDRAWLQARFGIAPQTPVVLAVGRINIGKNVMVLANAVRSLAAQGENLVLVCAGDGEDRSRVRALLGDAARCPGVVSGDDMARLYASADILAHPSEIETFGNVVAEGMAAGLPALVAAHAAPCRQIEDKVSGLVVGPGAADWAAAIRALLHDAPRRVAMGRAARQQTQRRYRDWRSVVAQDLLPLWRRAAGLPGPRLPAQDLPARSAARTTARAA
jgi:glycosyltransferase involved in cell wall biosynthesis